jgi:hypothetical protein
MAVLVFQAAGVRRIWRFDMATKKTTKKATKPTTVKSSGPSLFRINVEVADVERAAKEWGSLLGAEGRPQAGSRVYFTAGSVTLQVVEMDPPHPAAKALYFLVDELEPVFERAKTLGWLSKEKVHGAPGGEISVRPWGERSFYAEDPWGNPLCFVQSGTTYPG